ncbi:pilus assembly protein PilN [Natronospirillum operosum]|uniref:Pilus assembly protein PilN n=1 Tax=Natronospirillum operosum TaxID=2759953 RepID=A0A4Z0W8J9_9GAMM|nr:PilN domain-containing protein [Natronospirillum operosum]TGG93279.1 pilus assembly protein PilN [Natronospirillum operosum]
MITINLLPWREAERQRRKAQFVRVLIGSAVLAGLMVYAGHYFLGLELENQQARNQFIQERLQVMDENIREIETLRSERAELIERMQVIQQLQGDRPIIVHVFDEIARVMPDEVYFTSLQSQGNTLRIVGMSRTTTQISQLMRNFESSDWFTNPVLGSVTSQGSGATAANRFQLTVTRTRPDAEEGEG